MLSLLFATENPVAVQLQLAPVGLGERRERMLVACTCAAQGAVAHGSSVASGLTTVGTQSALQIRRRVSARDRFSTLRQLNPVF